jgi:hypothetical protein
MAEHSATPGAGSLQLDEAIVENLVGNVRHNFYEDIIYQYR